MTLDPQLLNSDVYTFILIPALIFVARVCDVTIGTIRILTLSKGYKVLTAILGFFELMVWLLAIGQLFQNLTSITCYVAYAGGFALGNYVGMCIEERLALGAVILRVITKSPADELMERFKEEEFGFTSIDAYGSSGPVHILFLVVQRKNIKKLVDIVNSYNPKAFYSIEDVRSVKEGIHPVSSAASGSIFRSIVPRKGK